MGSRVQSPLIIAHRGFHSELPENTISAFAMAVALGFDGIETDVQLDSFGTPILFHDFRLPDGRPVMTFSRAELSDLVGYPVPSLADALDAIDDVVWNIEIKNLAAVVPAAKVLSDFVGNRDLLVSSFVHAAVRHIGEALHVRGALLVAHCPDGALLLPARLTPEIDTVVWDCDTLDLAALDWATSIGLRNMVYGYRPEPGHAAFLRQAEIDGLITDFNIPLHRTNAKADWSQVF